MVEPTFSIPFRYLWNADLAGDLEIRSNRACGLDRFVGDEQNRVLRFLADRPAYSFCDSTAADWCPLVLYGPTGTGKTSLALSLISAIFEQATGDGRLGNFVEKPIVFPAVEFDRRFRAAIASDSVDDFRKRFLRSMGVVIDDLHQLKDKPAAQAELLQLVDQMQRKNRPLIITLDRNPLDCHELSAPLASRCSGGMCLPVNEPGREARKVILQDLADLHQVDIRPDSVEFLIDQLNVTVPKMFHFFQQLKTRLRATNKKTVVIDVPLITRMFHRSDSEKQKLAKIILKQVAAEFKIKLLDLCGNSRKQSRVRARGISIYLIRSLTGISFGKIGLLLGKRDHSTIMHAHEKMVNLLKEPITENSDDSLRSLKKSVFKLEKQLINLFAGEIVV